MKKLTIAAIAVLGILTACNDESYYKLRGYAQGGEYAVTYKGASLPPEKVKENVDSLLNEIDFTLSGYNKASLLSRLNRGETVVLTPMFAKVYRESERMWRETDGAFDPACAPLFDIWGFGFKRDSLPDEMQIEEAKAVSGMRLFVSADEVDSLVRSGAEVSIANLLKDKGDFSGGQNNRASLGDRQGSGAEAGQGDNQGAGEEAGQGDGQGAGAEAGQGDSQGAGEEAGQDDRQGAGAESVTGVKRLSPELNFNAIAQGLSSDIIYEYLKSLGVKDMLVDIGEIRCCGMNPSGTGWTIGIDNPVDGNYSPGADLRDKWNSQGRDCGIVTSGNYRKYYIVDGVKYSHTIDPRSGRPVQHNLLSATVIAPTASEADALATAFMVMGDAATKEFLAKRSDIQALLITSYGVWKSWE